MGKKMLGREAVTDEIVDDLPEWGHENSDHIITAYLAHMATLGWKMMPREMTDEMMHDEYHEQSQYIWMANAYDHAPEPTEDE